MRVYNMLIIWLFSCVLVFSFCSAAGGYGIGLYTSFNYGAGDGYWNMGSASNNENVEISTEEFITSFGLLYDTAIALDQFHNYRLNFEVGFGPVHFSGNNFKTTLDVFSLSMYHTFGFSLYRSSGVRLWLGPQLGFNYSTGDYSFLYSHGGVFPVYRVKGIYTELSFQLGFVAGINIHVSKTYSLSLDTGYRYRVTQIEVNDSKMSLHISKDGFYANLSVIYRISDIYDSDYESDELE